ncbi:MAG: DoxX family protein [Gemmatimonadota bacterium]|nr:DoxX family protein [Gemmatimonadota bacterium]
MPATTISTRQLWISRVLMGLSAAFLFVDAAMKIMRLAPAIQGSTELGYSAGSVRGIGILLLVCVIAYIIPRTSFIGAVLLTGYLGGAVASQVRVGNPLFSHILFPTYAAAMIWGALYLRDNRLRALLLSAPARPLA